MNPVSRFFQAVHTGFYQLWVLSLLLAVWTGLGFTAWFLPYTTQWTQIIRENTMIYLALGGLVHLLTLISHQQILFFRDFPTHPPTNLTLVLFFHRAVWLFLWFFPYYAFTAGIIFYRHLLLSLLQTKALSGSLWMILLSGIGFVFMLSLHAVFWTGACLIYRHQKQPSVFFLLTIWLPSMKGVWQGRKAWYLNYIFLLSIALIQGLFLWGYGLLWSSLSGQPLWHLIDPKGWVLTSAVMLIGLGSFFYPLFSIASTVTDPMNRSV